MQYIDDDMDELFRRAAENYPLKTDGADWEKVKKAFGNTLPDKKGKIKFRWIVILSVSFVWITNTFIAYQQSYDLNKENSFVKKTIPISQQQKTDQNKQSINKEDLVINNKEKQVEQKEINLNQLTDQKIKLISSINNNSKSTKSVENQKLIQNSGSIIFNENSTIVNS